MFVRTAGEADLSAVSTLLGVVWHDTYDGLYGAELVDRITRGHHSVAELTKQMQRPRSEFLLADDGKAIAGVAFAAAPGDDARIVIPRSTFSQSPCEAVDFRKLTSEEVAAAKAARSAKRNPQPK